MHKRVRINKPAIKTAAALGCLICTAVPQAVFASGFRVPEISILGLGTSNALVANTDELGALAYNPAGMSFHDGKGVVAGAVHIGYEHNVTIGGTTTEGNGEDSFLVPNLFVTARDAGASWSFGLAVNAPFGLETSYPDETFSSFTGASNTASDALEPSLSKIEMININPNFAYKLDEASSLSIGLMYYDVRELKFNSQGISVNGDGGGLGYSLAYLMKLDNFNVGVSYRSSVKTNLKGTFEASYAGSPPVGATASLEFPSMLQIGVMFQATDTLSAELDIEHTGWNSFDRINIDYSAGSTSSTNNWENSWAYRLGFIYRLNNNTKLLFGYSYDETPQPDSYFSARVPDNDRQLFSVGVTHDFGAWNLEAGYMHVKVDDRTFSGSAYGGAGTEANGTDAYDGTYKSEVNLLGVGLTMKF